MPNELKTQIFLITSVYKLSYDLRIKTWYWNSCFLWHFFVNMLIL